MSTWEAEEEGLHHIINIFHISIIKYITAKAAIKQYPVSKQTNKKKKKKKKGSWKLGVVAHLQSQSSKTDGGRNT
jgi:hypothetical protein